MGKNEARAPTKERVKSRHMKVTAACRGDTGERESSDLCVKVKPRSQIAMRGVTDASGAQRRRGRWNAPIGPATGKGGGLKAKRAATACNRLARCGRMKHRRPQSEFAENRKKISRVREKPATLVRFDFWIRINVSARSSVEDLFDWKFIVSGNLFICKDHPPGKTK